MNNIKAMIQNIDVNNLLDIFDIQIAIAVILAFTLFRVAFATAIIKIYYKIINKNRKAKESTMYKYLTTLSVLIGVYIAMNILPTNKEVMFFMNSAYRIIFIIYITKCLTVFTAEDSFVMKKLTQDKPNRPVNVLIAKVVRALMWVVAGFVILYEIGIDLNGIVAGLGLGAAAISLAAQDLVKSLLSGMAILTDKPFVIGDWIECGKYQGTVIDITYRSTRIKAANNAIITIPNSIITADYVINWNRLSSRRMDLNLAVTLDTPSEKVKKLVKQIEFVLLNDKEVMKDTVQVNVTDLSANGINILSIFYVRETDYYKYLKVKQNILCNFLDVVEKENIDLAYPAQTVYIKEQYKLNEVNE